MNAPVRSLGEDRRQFTRSRICAAAREVFALEGLDGATMEQIAAAAGTKRSTIYNHFSDKRSILDAIADDFGGKIATLIDQISSETPSHAEWLDWVNKAAIFAAEERAPTELFLELGSYTRAPMALENFGTTVFQAFATRLPAFRTALSSSQDAELVRLRATVAVRQLGAACAAHLTGKDAGFVRNMSIVAAELLSAFVANEGMASVERLPDGNFPRSAKS